MPTQRHLRLVAALIALAALATAAVAIGAPDPPTVTITEKPPDPSNSSSATFRFVAPGNVTYECAFDGTEPAECGSPYTKVGLADGTHTFAVRAKDQDGTAGEWESYSWLVDVITLTPNTNSRDASFEFSSHGEATFQCALDVALLADCTSPVSYTGLSEGRHTFRIEAADTFSKIGSDQYSWIVDTTGPSATIATAPATTTPAQAATFEFIGDEPGATFECALDAAVFAPCSSPTTYDGLSAGSHTFSVRALDALGNAGAPAVYTWQVIPLALTGVPGPVDQTPPDEAGPVDFFVGYRYVELTWAQPADADFDHVTVFHRTGASGPSVSVYSGNATTYKNTKFNNAVDHRYEIVSYDSAGNASTPATTVVPSSTLLSSPRRGARVRRSPTLTWAPISGARFYNVQLFRNGRKIMSTWPRRPRVQLATAWRYARHAYRLRRGRYDWYVWPAFGRPPSVRYGPALGHSTFVKR